MSELKLALWLVGCLPLLACLVEGEPDHPDPDAGAALRAATNPASTEAALLPSHLPCEVENIIRTRCKACHAPGSPAHQVSLLTYADLMQVSKSLPTLSYAQQALQMVQAGRMPPTSSLSPSDVQLFGNWVQAGAPSAECGGPSLDAGAPSFEAGVADAGFDSGAADARADAQVDAGVVDAGSPYDTPSQCTSNQHWTGGDTRSELMHPGRACINCHTTGVGLFNLQHGPSFTLAGTIFPSAHEPDDCNGAAGNGVSIVVKGANGQMVTMTPNTVGNFHSATRVTMPYTVEVHYQGRVRAMTTPQSMGDCNSCHTERGTSGAPGRIMLP
jgi:hypothetical protein